MALLAPGDRQVIGDHVTMRAPGGLSRLGNEPRGLAMRLLGGVLVYATAEPFGRLVRKDSSSGHAIASSETPNASASLRAVEIVTS